MAIKLIRYSKWSRTRIKSNRSLYKMLKRIRESQGIKATYVAARMSISKSHLSDLESGRRLWNNLLLAKYGEVVCPEFVEKLLNTNNNHAKSTN